MAFYFQAKQPPLRMKINLLLILVWTSHIYISFIPMKYICVWTINLFSRVSNYSWSHLKFGSIQNHDFLDFLNCSIFSKLLYTQNLLISLLKHFVTPKESMLLPLSLITLGEASCHVRRSFMEMTMWQRAEASYQQPTRNCLQQCELGIRSSNPRWALR